MNIIVAPLNWGLGHAARCIPLIRQFLAEGHDVFLAGNGESLTLLRQHFPHLRYVRLSYLNLHYSNGYSQVWTLLRQVPAVLNASLNDHYLLRQLLLQEHFDLVVSDNRFLFYSRKVKSVYITHQLQVLMPKHWRFLQPLATAAHRLLMRPYDEIWIPDYEDPTLSLAGKLSHLTSTPQKAKYIGPLSRFTNPEPTKIKKTGNDTYSVVAILSGLEPQRTLFEDTLIEQYLHTDKRVLIVRGKPASAQHATRISNITLVPRLDDEMLQRYLQEAETIVCRSGYSTIMDLCALGCLQKATFIPTPGQAEQEYLASRLKMRDLNKGDAESLQHEECPQLS